MSNLIDHSFGFGNGGILEYKDEGMIGIVVPLSFLPAAKVRLADITGVAASKDGMITQKLEIYGQGTTLALIKDLPYGFAERVDKWIREHKPKSESHSPVRAPEPKVEPVTKSIVGDDLVTKLERLAGLKASGAISEDEFKAAKTKLLA